MNDSPFSRDDPKLTAYALGELEADERAAVEAALRRSPALRATVAEIRATAAELESALAAEPMTQHLAGPAAPAVSHLNGHASMAGSARGEPPADPYAAPARGKLLRFPQFYYVVGGLAAACLAVVVAFNRDEYQARGRDRTEALRVAMEKRALETPTPPVTPPSSLAVVPTATEESVTLPLATEALSGLSTGTHIDAGLGVKASVPQAGPPVASDALAATSPAEPTRDEPAAITFAPGNLALLRQAQSTPVPPVPSRGTSGLGAALSPPSRSVKAKASTGEPGILSLVTQESARRVASTTGQPTIAAMGEGRPIAASAAPGTAGSSIEYTPSTRNTDARFAPFGSTDLFPGPSRPARNPTERGSQIPTYASNPNSAADVVKLDAFTVSAEREAGYAASASLAGQRISGAAREREQRRTAPTGAKFGSNTEAYSYVRDNEFVRAALNPLSTFSVDVDTASYSNVRRMLEQGRLPPRDAVRIEELLNYFPYGYAPPEPARSRSLAGKLWGDESAPFAASLEIAEAPWAPLHRLVRIGLKGREVATADRPAANLVFLLDVSGSMNEPNKLPLVKESLRLLVGKLRPDDRVAIVTYAGHSGLALPSTPVARAADILAAIDTLRPEGSTNGAGGLQLAYQVAAERFAPKGINRVILCTDGDFNVGPSSEGELVRLIEEHAGTGVFLTVLGFGMGNLKDAMLEKLADKGNGHYGYIDSRREAQKLLVEQVSSTLVTIAKDVKIQVEFNPARVSSYRLIGYENRLLNKEDFNDDRADAGEIGAGHAVTALYEVVPVGVESPAVAASRAVDDLKYSSYASQDAFSSRLAMPGAERAASAELLTVKVRYKKPGGIISRKLEFPLTDGGRTFANASADFRFAAAVAEFGMILRKSEHKGTATLGDVIAWAAAAAANPADDPGGYRGAFIDLARQAQEILKAE